jgi:hypothetical protein
MIVDFYIVMIVQCFLTLAVSDLTPLSIVTQPAMGYARQALIVQPVIKVNAAGTGIVVEAEVRDSSNQDMRLFGNPVQQAESGFANFTNLGFFLAGEYRLSFTIAGQGTVNSDMFSIQVLIEQSFSFIFVG